MHSTEISHLINNAKNFYYFFKNHDTFPILVSIVDERGSFHASIYLIGSRNFRLPSITEGIRMGILTIEETTLSKVQTFESVEAMNEAMKGYKLEYELTQTDGAILDAISRYACKYTGVCFLSKDRKRLNSSHVSISYAVFSLK